MAGACGLSFNQVVNRGKSFPDSEIADTLVKCHYYCQRCRNGNSSTAVSNEPRSEKTSLEAWLTIIVALFVIEVLFLILTWLCCSWAQNQTVLDAMDALRDIEAFAKPREELPVENRSGSLMYPEQPPRVREVTGIYEEPDSEDFGRTFSVPEDTQGMETTTMREPAAASGRQPKTGRGREPKEEARAPETSFEDYKGGEKESLGESTTQTPYVTQSMSSLTRELGPSFQTADQNFKVTMENRFKRGEGLAKDRREMIVPFSDVFDDKGEINVSWLQRRLLEAEVDTRNRQPPSPSPPLSR